MIVGDGRAFRFVALVGAGWIVLRVAMLWPTRLPEAISRAVERIVPTAAAADDAAAVRRSAPPIARRSRTPLAGPSRVENPRDTPPVPPPLSAGALMSPPVAGALAEAAPAIQPIDRPPVTASVPFGPGPVPNRWSVSAWLIARRGLTGETPLAPQLGGTQGGVRIDYAVGAGFAATARIAAPAAGAGRELSLGLAWRPRGVPLRFVAEHRLALDGAPGGPSLGLSGGVDAVALPGGFALDGYAQAGTILRSGRLDHFADGSARATRPVVTLGETVIDAGAGAWGGAQRGVARFDIGPTIGARVPVVGRRLRIAIDWRQRIAGEARPGSGPALTLGTDF